MKFLSCVLSAVLFFTADSLLAQSTYINSANDTIVIDGQLNHLQTLSIHQVNTSTDSIVFKWKKVSETLPIGWEASICDNSTCYTSLLDSGITNAVITGDYVFIIIHCTPKINNGIGIIRYAIWDTQQSNHKDTLTFILKVVSNSSYNNLSVNNEKNNWMLYPNPVDDCFKITNLSDKITQLKLVNELGSVENKFHYLISPEKTECEVDVLSLSKGIYFIILETDKKISSKKIIKN
ncbi:MAG: hypothetical protein RL065_1425 [Bacteroidota bacterium]